MNVEILCLWTQENIREKHKKTKFSDGQSKQDRLVRLMMDHMSEHMYEIKALEANPNCKELEIEWWVQTLLKSCLGYSATNGYSSLKKLPKVKPLLYSVCVINYCKT